MIHWFIETWNHWFIDSLIQWFVGSLFHWFITLLNHCFIGSLSLWFADLLIGWCFDPLPFAHSLMHLTNLTVHGFCSANNFPAGHWFLIEVSIFRNFRPDAGRALPCMVYLYDIPSGSGFLRMSQFSFWRLRALRGEDLPQRPLLERGRCVARQPDVTWCDLMCRFYTLLWFNTFQQISGTLWAYDNYDSKLSIVEDSWI